VCSSPHPTYHNPHNSHQNSYSLTLSHNSFSHTPISEFVFPHPTYLGGCQRARTRRLRVLMSTTISHSHTLHTIHNTTLRTSYIRIFVSHPTHLGMYRCDALGRLCLLFPTPFSYSPTHDIPSSIIRTSYIKIRIPAPYIPVCSCQHDSLRRHRVPILTPFFHSHTLFSFLHTTHRGSNHNSHTLP